MSDEHAKN
jgi:hypothetical protein